MKYSEYTFLQIEKKDNGVALITMNRPEVLNACDAQGHHELGQIWKDIAEDPDVRVGLITGAGRAFCAGGNLGKADTSDPAFVQTVMKHDTELVYSMINCPKPIVSAINGAAVGAGLAVALLADISIASDRAKLIDGHTKLGVVPGDHAAIIWPLLCGMAKAKYYLYLCETITGEEADRIGLVSRCVPHDELMGTAMGIADRLAAGSQWALLGAKSVMNNWLRMAGPIFDQSAVLEMASFFLPDSKEGLSAFMDKRQPDFPSSRQ